MHYVAIVDTYYVTAYVLQGHNNNVYTIAVLTIRRCTWLNTLSVQENVGRHVSISTLLNILF